MKSFVALLRAVNVGGTGKLPMTQLVEICRQAGFSSIQTYIASGNAVLKADMTEEAVKTALEARLKAHFGKPVAVAVRTAPDLARILSENPFTDTPPNWVTVIFLDKATSPATLAGVTGRADDEELKLGPREIYVRYGSGVGRSKLRIPAAVNGTARNLNTLVKLTSMTSA